MGEHHVFGRQGEQTAIDFLTEKGYQILKQNYRYDKAEIDILAFKDNILAVVEVKSRTTGFLEDITQTINTSKIKRLVKAANQYVLENDLDCEVRFDIITVLKKGKELVVEHMESAFYQF